MLKDLVNRFVEKISPVPVAKPLNLRVPSQSDRIMALVRHEFAMASRSNEVETFEDADDFELENEEWFSPHEQVFEPTEEAPAVAQAIEKLRAPAAPAAPTPAVQSAE